jgi:hypothetical protein
MGDIVNLRTVRRQRARDERSREADARRVQFGRTKAERKGAERLADIQDRRLDGHRRVPEAQAPSDVTQGAPPGEPEGRT